ncbi:MAG: ribonuclease P protein component [bacterium]|nr:ribonuclease P protein component [bacterium]MDE0288061.1 ribonuclease P protein component [bacterium]MDE0438508.1 ribonuclease P protein component [bacterium]
MSASLSGSVAFDRVLRSGVRCRRGGITVIGLERGPGPARVGLVVGRRVGKAVKRNRVKRRLRAGLREIGLKDGIDYVVIGSSAVAGIPFSTLRGWLREAVAVIGSGKEGT